MPRLLLQPTTAPASSSSNQSLGNANKNGIVPSQNDILSGRGKHNYCHYGNKYFLSLVKQYQFKCVTCPKSLKPVYAKAIYQSLRKLDPPAKFLKATCVDNDVVVWEEMSHRETMAKIRHAMRDYEARMQRKKTSAFIKHTYPKAVASVDINKEDEGNGMSSVPNQEKIASQLDVSMSSLRNVALLGHNDRSYFAPIHHSNMHGTMNHANPQVMSFGGHTYVVLNQMDRNNLHRNVTTVPLPMQLLNSPITGDLHYGNVISLNNFSMPDRKSVV